MEASGLSGDEPAADRRLEQREQAAAVLAAITELPPLQREPATLFFVWRLRTRKAWWRTMPLSQPGNAAGSARVGNPDQAARNASCTTVDLTRRYQHAAFGSALALLRDFQQAEDAAGLAPVDAVIHLSRNIIQSKIFSAVDVMTSRSRLLETKAVDPEHAAIVERVREAIAALRAVDGQPQFGADALVLERARKLQNFFAQPFFVAEPYTKCPGSHVSRADALSGCREILDGEHDDLPVEAFYFSGSITEIRERG